MSSKELLRSECHNLLEGSCCHHHCHTSEIPRSTTDHGTLCGCKDTSVASEIYSQKEHQKFTVDQFPLKTVLNWEAWKNRSANMSTQWRQNAFLILTTAIIFLLGLILFFYLPNDPPKNAQTTDDDFFNFESNTVNYTFETDDWTNQGDFENEIFNINTSGAPNGITIDYVTPIKLHNLSLNADDLLYESKRNKDKKDYISAFSVTGNFRSKSSQIWDPHPEYNIKVFGHQLHLVLHQDTSFIAPKTFRVIRILNNETEIQDVEGHYLGCYYKGYVSGDEQSAVAVSLCNGMTGHIKTQFGSLLIQPIEAAVDDKSEILHKVWRQSKRHARHSVAGHLDMDLGLLEQSLFSTLSRKKRNADRHLFTMEVLVAVDKTMNEFHKEDLKSYILTLISIVSNIFSDASIGNSIYISVANILILKDDIVAVRKSRREKNISASQLLKHFCSFLEKRGYHYDTAIMLTRDQICRNERETKCDTLGLAELGTVCKRYSCSIVQDNGLPAAFTIAHELGHILNMPHDDDARCQSFKPSGSKNSLHIMSSIMGDDIHPWSWSDCSRHYVSEFLEKEDTSCLEDSPQVFIPNYNTKQPGEMYSLDQQCRLIHGNRSKFCYIDGECKRLWCKTQENLSDCRSSNLPWADGTPCRNKRYWCQKGECVPREGIARQVVNGGWGAWSPFTPCSMTCGGGVQESQRECNNPLPQNGGKYCTGSRKKYRSCNTISCPSHTMDSREQQCYNMNGMNFDIKGIDNSVTWIPKYGLSFKDKCKLYCRLEDNSAYFQLADKVRDGTTCSFDTFDKCVNGICRPAGCDNELNSIAKLDKCGVCEGRNDTCEEYTGNFYVSDLFKKETKSKSFYYYVTKISKGSSNIEITQPGYNTENYIVLRDEYGNSLLNGNQVINTYRNVFFYGGVSFEYNGSNSTIERVNTTYSRKLKRDLIVEIISLSINSVKDDSILLTYSYTIEKPYINEAEDNLYRWELQQWSTCDSLCHGNSFRSAVCINTATAHKVASSFCDSSPKPTAEYRKCNTECILSLNITSISECSASCGMLGTREKTYYCIQIFPNISRSNIVDLSYCESKFQFNKYEQCREACWNYTDWSPCSQTCGAGQQTRDVGCFLNQTRVDPALCNIRKLSMYEDTTRVCNMGSCDEDLINYEDDDDYLDYNSWTTSNWGKCDDNCEQNRTVKCEQPYGTMLCPIEKKPIARRKCCTIKYISTWSGCSVDCGIGTRKKEFKCAKVYKPEGKGSRRTRVLIDDKYCNRLRMPSPKRSRKQCKMICKWEVDDWSQCHKNCSVDYQIRSVNCASSDGRSISSKHCDAARKPISKRICSNCIRHEYKVTKCNCEGFRRRRIICFDSQRKRIPCQSKQKIIKEKCPSPQECFPKSCTDLQRFHKYSTDKDYTIFIKQKPKRIYCYDMSKRPKEYITVNQNENYSIYYDNKTTYPDLCPPQSRNFEYKDESIGAGRTHFRKIRLNLTNLQIIEDDYTFADSIGRPQTFGSAGDCYNSKGDCPQGDFSINLDKTGFIIKPGVVWNRAGPSFIMKVSSDFETSPTSRRAFCGGYCGRCSISRTTGLFLDVV